MCPAGSTRSPSAPNPDWSRTFSRQPEIQAYLQDVARTHRVYDHCVFGAELTDARWDAETGRWQVQTTAGPFLAQFLVVGTGALSAPADPALPGLESFTGRTFHSARWDHDYDLRGHRVAVIGTGASAVQLVPEIAPLVEHLDVYQRTPAWILPRTDRVLSTFERRLYRRVPAAARVTRAGIYVGREAYVVLFAKHPKLAAPARRMAERHLDAQVLDPSLRERLRPDFGFGCKRVLISSDYYPALQRRNVELISDPISSVGPDAISTADGTERPVDAIIFATGFHVTDAPITALVRDGDGISLAEHWRDGMQALRGTTVPGYPNFFMIVGPNTGLGHTSMIYMIESQVAYISDAVRNMDDRGLAVLSARADSTADYNADVQAKLGRSVWNSGGCRSWYLDAAGRNTTLWPDFTFRFRRATRRIDLGRVRHPTGPRRCRTPVRELAGRVVAITGAGSGIGRALALHLGGLGARLALSDQDLAAVDDTLRRTGLPPADARSYRVDVTDAAAVSAWADQVVAELGAVHVLINNAGVALIGDVVSMELADIASIMDVDFWGVVHGTKAFLPHLIAGGEGHIVTISSVFGLIGVPSQSAYNAAKFAVRGFTESLRQEMILAGHPVGVTCVHPGGVRTDVVRNSRVLGAYVHADLVTRFEQTLARTSPERAAVLIVRGIRRNRARVLIGADAYAIDGLVRLFGPGYQRVIVRAASRLDRTGAGPGHSAVGRLVRRRVLSSRFFSSRFFSNRFVRNRVVRNPDR